MTDSRQQSTGRVTITYKGVSRFFFDWVAQVLYFYYTEKSTNFKHITQLLKKTEKYMCVSAY